MKTIKILKLNNETLNTILQQCDLTPSQTELVKSQISVNLLKIELINS